MIRSSSLTSALSEQERDLLRAFRARLFDVQTELEKEKSKADDGASIWIEKNRQLEKDLDWAKEMADRLERVNQALGKENKRLKSQFSSQVRERTPLVFTFWYLHDCALPVRASPCLPVCSSLQEDDREFLIRQLVAVKKDNARLRSDLQDKTARLAVCVCPLIASCVTVHAVV